jgi:hypothetical protein
MQIAGADYFYVPQKEDSNFCFYHAERKTYVALKGEGSTPPWRLFECALREGENYEKHWAIVSTRPGTIPKLDDRNVVDKRTVREELLCFARDFVSRKREDEWNAANPYDAYFEIVKHPEQSNRTRFSVAIKNIDSSRGGAPYTLLPIVQYTDKDKEMNSLLQWSIGPDVPQTPLKTMVNVPFLRKENVPKDKLDLCRSVVKKMICKVWRALYPEDRCFQICVSRKSVYEQIIEKFPRIRFRKYEGTDVLDARKSERKVIEEIMGAEVNHVPKNLFVHALKKRYNAYIAYLPYAIDGRKEWSLFKMNGLGTMVTTKSIHPRNLANYNLIEKWFWKNEETLQMARTFFGVVKGKKSL